ncbi:MAG: hypothetical protein CMP67_05350 [Flavobacteriales bacterium]|nr:hypothetical protein [Flavobacteriales bacterium]MBO72476.1 hypothetical protein [Flavobacteriales bacterium]
MKIHKKILSVDFDYFDQAEMYSQMPKNIKAVLGDKSSPKRMLSLLGWQLLAENLPDSRMLSGVEFGDKGKPFIPNSNIWFNISNTRGIVVLAIHNQPVGIDVERLRKPREVLYKRVFCSEEINSICSPEDFTNLWTRKEAVVKLFGGGISMGLNSFSVIHDEVKAFGKQIKIEPVLIDGFFSHTAVYL